MNTSSQDLRSRYLWIAKNSLSFLKDKGFQKKGVKYFKQKKDLILNIYPYVTRAWLNSPDYYEFGIEWELSSVDPKLIQLSIFMWGNKNIKEVRLMGTSAFAENRLTYLTDKDPMGYDQKFVDEVKANIETFLLPLLDNIHSIDDVIRLAEEEEKLEQGKRILFPYTVTDYLAHFYAYNGWKEKTLEMCDKHIETTPVTSRDLAEKKKLRYIKYFEKTPSMTDKTINCLKT